MKRALTLLSFVVLVLALWGGSACAQTATPTVTATPTATPTGTATVTPTATPTPRPDAGNNIVGVPITASTANICTNSLKVGFFGDPAGCIYACNGTKRVLISSGGTCTIPTP